MSLCSCGHRHPHGKCGKPIGSGHGKRRRQRVCGCFTHRPAQPNRERSNGVPTGKRWDTRNLRRQARPETLRRREAERKRSRGGGRLGGPGARRLSGKMEAAIEAMQRRLNGEGL